MDRDALLLTFRLSAVTTLILMVIALPLGYWLAYGESRARHWVEAVVALPLVLPPTVLGFYLLVLLGPRTAAGRLLIRLTGHPLAFTFSGLVIGSVIYSLPFAVQPVASGFSSIRRDVREAALLLSPGRSTAVRRVFLPAIRPFLVTAAVLSFAHTVGEFGVVLMIGGGIPGVTRTLSISIYDQVQGFRYPEANHTSLLLLAISFIALVFLYRRQGMARV